jgi:CRISPR-associated protein Csb2
MLAIGLELLTGRYVATAYNDRSSAEWPPHPARVFSALVATWQEGEASEPDGHEECAALRFLERLEPPRLLCSGSGAIARRTVVPVFVAVNDAATVSEPDCGKLQAAERALAGASDEKGRSKALKDLEKASKKLHDDTAKAIAPPTKFTADVALGARVLPEQRGKQPRTFPSLTPSCPSVALLWPNTTIPDGLRSGLQRLLRRLVRVGHSSSMVSARLLEERETKLLQAATTAFVPDDDHGEHILRWVSEGQVERLRNAFELHRETEPRVLPARFVRYREGDLAVARTPVPGVFSNDDVVIFARVGGPRLPITSIVGVARQLRRALIAAADPAVPSLLSGHADNGEALQRPHLAIVPLPVVGHEHADGAIVGIAIVFPRACDPAERTSALAAIGKLEQQQGADDEPPVIPLRLGEAGVLELQRVAWGEHPTRALQPRHWTRPSRGWGSATPVALDRNPGNLHDENLERRGAAFSEARELIRAALERAGYPAPSELDVVRSCVIPGSAKPRAYPRFPIDQQRPQRVLVHARLVFPKPVRGPILLGSGRFLGLGLFFPIDQAYSSEAS